MRKRSREGRLQNLESGKREKQKAHERLKAENLEEVESVCGRRKRKAAKEEQPKEKGGLGLREKTTAREGKAECFIWGSNQGSSRILSSNID